VNDQRLPNPWWIPHFLGRVPRGVDDRSLRLLGPVALALLFEEYDLGMLTAALKYIAADVGMAEEKFGFYLAMIRLGSIPAFALVPFADRIGRRPVFVLATAAMGLMTFATGFARTPLQFVFCQSITRIFFIAGSAVAFVIIAEEFPARHRGWGVGMLAALGHFGHGLSAGMFSQIERLPYGWRFLYALGLVPILLVPYFLKRIRETGRFAHQVREQEKAHLSSGNIFGLLSPLRELATTHPRRAIGIALSGFVTAAATLTTFQFGGYFTQTEHGLTPAQYAWMVIVGGGIGIIGNIAGGRLGDRFGRKRVGFILLSVFPLTALAFYHGSLWVMVGGWVGLVFSSMGGRIILRAMSTELFPTGHRSAAAGTYSVLETLGAVAGLLLFHFYGTENVGDMARAVSMIASLNLIGAIILLTFPETRQRELEEISGEKEKGSELRS
jgi:putative MFS transporter